ncbi:MAG: YgfZ/GcvT domain-containing protein [Actinomycetota bacterium]
MANGKNADLLAAGRAFADISSWRTIAVSGTDALEWLDDLVTADLSDLPPGMARPALLLTPTGGIRASFTVTAYEGDPLLLQDPAQPASIERLLDPYVLSSDVQLDDRTTGLAIFSFPGLVEAPDATATAQSAPSCLGAGVDLLAAAQDHDDLLRSMSNRYTQARDEDVEAWRIAAGIPRFGIDALEGDLPQESGLSDAVSRGKGCFPGQEAVAKVDSLGHPRRLVLALEAAGPASPGDAVMLDGSEVGQITSAAGFGVGTYVMARLRWEARDAHLRTAPGTELRRRAA